MSKINPDNIQWDVPQVTKPSPTNIVWDDEPQYQERNEFNKGVIRGMEGMKAAGHGAVGLIGSALGIDSFKDWGYKGFRQHEAEASKYPGRVQNVEDIKGLSDIPDWAIGNFGSLVPSIGEAGVTAVAGAIIGSAIGPEGTVAGGVGGLVGKQAVKGMIRKLAKEYVVEGMEKQVAKKAAKEAIESLPAKAIYRNLGTKAGIVAGTAPIEAGGMWGEGMQQGKDNPYSAAVLGTISGLTELLGGEAELIDVFTNPARRAVKGNLIQRIGAELGKTIPQEATQEATQEVLSLINRKIVDPSFDIVGPEARSRILNSAAAGALGGVAFGTGAGVMSRPAQTTQQDETLSTQPLTEPQQDSALGVDWTNRQITPVPGGNIAPNFGLPATDGSGTVNLSEQSFENQRVAEGPFGRLQYTQPGQQAAPTGYEYLTGEGQRNPNIHDLSNESASAIGNFLGRKRTKDTFAQLAANAAKVDLLNETATPHSLPPAIGIANPLDAGMVQGFTRSAEINQIPATDRPSAVNPYAPNFTMQSYEGEVIPPSATPPSPQQQGAIPYTGRRQITTTQGVMRPYEGELIHPTAPTNLLNPEAPVMDAEWRTALGLPEKVRTNAEAQSQGAVENRSVGQAQSEGINLEQAQGRPEALPQVQDVDGQTGRPLSTMRVSNGSLTGNLNGNIPNVSVQNDVQGNGAFMDGEQGEGEVKAPYYAEALRKQQEAFEQSKQQSVNLFGLAQDLNAEGRDVEMVSSADETPTNKYGYDRFDEVNGNVLEKLVKVFTDEEIQQFIQSDAVNHAVAILMEQEGQAMPSLTERPATMPESVARILSVVTGKPVSLPTKQSQQAANRAKLAEKAKGKKKQEGINESVAKGGVADDGNRQRDESKGDKKTPSQRVADNVPHESDPLSRNESIHEKLPRLPSFSLTNKAVTEHTTDNPNISVLERDGYYAVYDNKVKSILAVARMDNGKPEYVEQSVQGLQKRGEERLWYDQWIQGAANEARLSKTEGKDVVAFRISPEDITDLGHDTANIERLRLGISAYEGKPVARTDFNEVSVSGRVADNLRRIAGIFDKELVFFVGRSATNTGYEGVQLTGDTKNIYINANSDTPHMQIIGHELMHHLQQDDKKLFLEFFNDLVKSGIRNYQIYDIAMKSTGKFKTDTEITLEFTSEFIGQKFVDQKFWDVMLQRNPSLYARVLDYIKNFLNYVKGRFEAFHDIDKAYIENIDEARQLAVDLMSKYAEGKGGNNVPTISERNTDNASGILRMVPEGMQGSVRTATSKGIEKAITKITAKLPIGKVEVAQSESNLPEHLQDAIKSQNAQGRVEGIYDPETGKVYLVADNLQSADRAQEVLKHELVHGGIASVFGKNLNLNLQQIYNQYKDAITKIAKSYGFDLTNSQQRMKATEEFVARHGEKYQQMPVFQRMFAAMRRLLREMGFTVQWSEKDLLALAGKAIGKQEGGKESALSLRDAYDTEILVNPTRGELGSLLRESRYKELRVVKDPETGDLYVADAGKTYHKFIAEKAGIAWDKISGDPEYMFTVTSNTLGRAMNGGAKFSLAISLAERGIPKTVIGAIRNVIREKGMGRVVSMAETITDDELKRVPQATWSEIERQQGLSEKIEREIQHQAEVNSRPIRQTMSDERKQEILERNIKVLRKIALTHYVAELEAEKMRAIEQEPFNAMFSLAETADDYRQQAMDWVTKLPEADLKGFVQNVANLPQWGYQARTYAERNLPKQVLDVLGKMFRLPYWLGDKNPAFRPIVEEMINRMADKGQTTSRFMQGLIVDEDGKDVVKAEELEVIDKAVAELAKTHGKKAVEQFDSLHYLGDAYGVEFENAEDAQYHTRHAVFYEGKIDNTAWNKEAVKRGGLYMRSAGLRREAYFFRNQADAVAMEKLAKEMGATSTEIVSDTFGIKGKGVIGKSSFDLYKRSRAFINTLYAKVKEEYLETTLDKYRNEPELQSRIREIIEKSEEASMEEWTKELFDAFNDVQGLKLIMPEYQNRAWWQDLVKMLKDRKVSHKLEKGVTKEEALKKYDEQVLSHTLRQDEKEDKELKAAYRKVLTNKMIERKVSQAAENVTQARKTLKDMRQEVGNILGWVPRVRQEGAYKVYVYEVTKDELGEEKKIEVFMQMRNSLADVAKLEKDVLLHPENYFAVNYREGRTYVTSSETNTKPSEQSYNNRGNDAHLLNLMMAARDQLIHKGMDVELANQMDKAFTQELMNVLLARGAGRSQIHRNANLIEGYETNDVMGKIKDYINGMAGMISKGRYAIRQLDNISKLPPELKEDGIDYTQDTMKNMGYLDKVSGVIRSVISLWFLGMKPAAIFINMTQNYTFGQAFLSIVTKNSVRKLYRAQKDVLYDYLARQKGKASGRLSEEETAYLEKAVRDGVFFETVMSEMTGSHEGTMGKKSEWLQKLTTFAMSPFQFVEQVMNREAAFLARFRVARNEQKLSEEDSYKAAVKFMNDAHFMMGKGNQVKWARNPIGKTLATLQNYLFNALNAMYNLATSGERAQVIALARLFASFAVLGGLGAIPFGDDINKLLRRITGKDYRLEFEAFTKKEAKNFGTPGELVNDFIWRGLPSIAQVDLSGALAMRTPFLSGIIAGDDAVQSVSGPVGGMAVKASRAAKSFSRGDWSRGLEAAAPEAVAGVMRGVRQATEGSTTLSGKVIPGPDGKPMKMTYGEAFIRSLGFQPIKQAEAYKVQESERALSQWWNDERQAQIDRYRLASPSERIKMRKEINSGFNASLKDSQVEGLVKPIKPETLTNALKFKPNKGKMKFEGKYLEE